MRGTECVSQGTVMEGRSGIRKVECGQRCFLWQQNVALNRVLAPFDALCWLCDSCTVVFIYRLVAERIGKLKQSNTCITKRVGPR